MDDDIFTTSYPEVPLGTKQESNAEMLEADGTSLKSSLKLQFDNRWYVLDYGSHAFFSYLLGPT